MEGGKEGVSEYSRRKQRGDARESTSACACMVNVCVVFVCFCVYVYSEFVGE